MRGLTMHLRTPIPHTRELFADESLYQQMLVHLAEKMSATDEDRERQVAALTAETLTLQQALVCTAGVFVMRDSVNHRRPQNDGGNEDG